jgi:predicted amidohydrolase YtcJ
MTQEQVDAWISRCDQNGVQVQVHTNGDAAWQNFEEDRKGNLETGKLADLVILSDDPLAVDPMAIMDIRVMQTIKDGVVVYSAMG